MSQFIVNIAVSCAVCCGHQNRYLYRYPCSTGVDYDDNIAPVDASIYIFVELLSFTVVFLET
ncbi:hypothetical protein QTP88_019659 [Uroleucon formosanum]